MNLLPKIAVTYLAGLTYLSASINMTVNFTAQAETDLSASEQALFTNAVNFWGQYITGYRDGVSRNWDLTVDTFSQAASGGGVLLGSAGPSGLTLSNAVPGSGLGGSWPNRFIISTGGNANFNVHPDAGGLSESTIRHEIGHALGIGTLWEDNEVYSDGVAGNHNRTLAGGIAGQYVGAAALSAFQEEFGMPLATYVPIELDGGGGTANGHWNEVTDNFSVEDVAGFDLQPGDEGPAPTIVGGINAGQSLDNELMTGVSSGSSYISNTTIASLYDIGYTISELAAVPEASATVLLVGLFGLGVTLTRRRRLLIESDA